MTDLLHQMHHDLRRLARENERLREEVANAATAERARLAGMASEEDRAMVERIMPACPKRLLHERWKHSTNAELALAAKMCSPDYPCGDCVLADAARTTLLARLAAARGEALEEAIRWAWANHERFHVDSEDEVVRDALAALLPRGPDAATGTGVGNG